MTMTVDPSAEWHQMFNDAWRIERDYFYDPGMHGVDWNTMRSRYGKLIDDAVSRWDVSFVLGELIGELNSSHTYVQGGQYENGPRRTIGLLGADFALEGGYFCITKIYDGGEWDSEVRSPLKRPGIKVSEGDYLLAVNGKPLDPTKDVGASFEGLANAVVSITVNDKPTLTGARTVLVKPLADESRLRNLAWIESNRKRVDQATHGRVGYVYVPNTGVDGQTELVRQYRAQTDKDGMIIDERFNSGGQIPDRFVELLDRPDRELLEDARRRAAADAADRQRRAEGDARQRLERLGRRRVPVLLQATRTWAPDRPTHMGWTHRHQWHAVVRRRWQRHRADIRRLWDRRQMDHRRPRRGARHRRRRRPDAAREGRRSAARSGDQGSDDRG